MKWLADENIPKGTIAFLRQGGAVIAESSRGLHDEQVTGLARDQGRVLLSFDPESW